MPVHDWTKVDDGVFHDFHHEWISQIKHALNRGVLPRDYYAMADQVAGPGIPDVLGLKRQGPAARGSGRNSGTALATAVPKVRFHDRAAGRRKPVRRPKRVAVRHVTGDRVVALIEIVSTGNKSSRGAIRTFADKLVSFVEEGIHLMVLDLFPPSSRDPQGIHPLIWGSFHKTAFRLPPDKPLTQAAYNAGPVPEAYVEPVAVGDRLAKMPLFLTPDEYVNVPLDASYQAAWAEVPERWQAVVGAAR
jgi:hypothetical protein